MAATLVNLAELARARGDYNQAAARYARALAIREEAFGIEIRGWWRHGQLRGRAAQDAAECVSSPSRDALAMR